MPRQPGSSLLSCWPRRNLMDDSSPAAALLEQAASVTSQSAADANGSNLPECQYRFSIGEKDLYFCRHGNVHTKDHLVDAPICQGCGQRTRPCLLPRVAPK